MALSFFPSFVLYLPGDLWFHRLLSVVVVVLGLIGFLPGYRLHRRLSLLLLIAAGVTLILFVAWNGETLSELEEIALSTTVSLLLVTAHLLNRSFCRQCRACNATAAPCATSHIR